MPTVNPSRNITALLLALAFFAWAPAATAQSVGPDHIIRFEEDFRKAGRDGVRIVMHRPPGTNGWDLRLVDMKDSSTLGVTRFPEWTGAAYYDYEAKPVTLSGAEILLFSAKPSSRRNAPPAASQFQVAHAYGQSPRGNGKIWKQIANTTYSELDGGTRLEVRDTNKRTELVRITTEESTFCGGDMGYHVFVPESMAFRTEIALEEALTETEKVKATLPQNKFEPSPYRGFYLWFSASSNRRNSDDSLTVIRPLELGDLSLETAWAESDPGDGREQWVTARLNTALKVRGVRIFPGVGSSEKEFRKYRRPKKLLIATGDGARFEVEIPDLPFRTLMARGGVFVELPRPIRTRCFSLVILDSRPALDKRFGEEHWKTTSVAMSEVTPVSELFGLPPDVAALVVVEMLLKKEDPAQARRLALLASPLGADLVDVLRDVVAEGTEEDRARVAPLLRYMPAEQAVPVLIELFRTIDSDDRSYLAVKRAMVTHREHVANQLVNMLTESPPEDDRKHADLLRLVGRLGAPEDIRPLIRRLGENGRQIRQERIRALTRGGAGMLEELFAVARTRPNTGAGHDALQALSSLGRQLHFRDQGAPPDADSLAVAYRKSKDRRDRLLALRGMRYFRSDAALELLPGVANTAEDPLVRRSALEAIARYPEREARLVLESSLNDPSPDVRIEAVQAIEHRSDRTRSVAALMSYVEDERWPQGLESGFGVIAAIGNERARQYLHTELLRTAPSKRAELIAQAFERNDKAIDAATVAEVLSREDRSFMLTRHLIDSLGVENSEQGQKLLIDIIESETPFPNFEPRRNEILEGRAILSLGRRRTFAARKLLLDLLHERKDSQSQKMLLRSLAFFEDESLIPELEVRKEAAPQGLQSAYQAAIDMIERRARIKSVEETVDAVDDRIQRVREAGENASD